MNKILLVMRHAKSSWDDESLSDHDRPLNQRGQRDAPRMADWLAEHESVPDVILSSTANRAKTTAQIIEDKSGFEGDLSTYENLYLGGPDDYLRLVARLDDSVNVAMVVGHNPGLEELVFRLTRESELMPTAAVAKIDLKIDRWLTAANVKEAELIDLWRPKEIFA